MKIFTGPLFVLKFQIRRTFEDQRFSVHSIFSYTEKIHSYREVMRTIFRIFMDFLKINANIKIKPHK